METELVCVECYKPINSKDEYTIIGASKNGEVERVLCSDCRTALREALDRKH